MKKNTVLSEKFHGTSVQQLKKLFQFDFAPYSGNLPTASEDPQKLTVKDQCDRIRQICSGLLETLASKGEQGLVELYGFEEPDEINDPVITKHVVSGYVRQLFCVVRFCGELLETISEQRQTSVFFLLYPFAPP